MEAAVEISTDGTVMPRHMAAILDNLFAFGLAIMAAKMVDEKQYLLHIGLMVIGYLGYYFVLEAALSRTIGKLMMGLVVVRVDGSRISIRDAAMRTVFRVLEVNPFLLGGLPAAVSIIYSENHQRIGDKVAGTLVVSPRAL